VIAALRRAVRRPAVVRGWARRRLLEPALKRVVHGFGYTLLRESIYSPIPDLPAPTSPFWARRSDLPGLTLDTEAQLRFLASTLAPHLAEFRPPLARADGGDGFYLDNGYYGRGDAEVLYAMVRWRRPRRLLELGAGFSTLVSALACGRNAAEGYPAELVAIDPAPRRELTGLVGLTRLERAGATDVPLARFTALEAHDILFVDTTHTVKLGGDVNYLVLDVLPRLRPGVLVHFHDIYLPYEYPRRLLGGGTFLSEQYLLQAFLAFNRDYQVVLALHALARDHPRRLAATLPGVTQARHGPSAFWIVRR
jgi:hypothetical protein